MDSVRPPAEREASESPASEAEAGIQKTTRIPGQARNDHLDDTVGVTSSHDLRRYGYLMSIHKLPSLGGRGWGRG